MTMYDVGIVRRRRFISPDEIFFGPALAGASPMGTTWTDLRSLGRNTMGGVNIDAGPSLTAVDLNSAYSFGSSGVAYGGAFFCSETGTLTDLWVYVSNYNGSWAGTDGHIDVTIHDDLNGSLVPGSQVAGSPVTITLDGTTNDTWVHKTGLSISLTAGKLYLIVVGDADGGGTNWVTMNKTNGVAPMAQNIQAGVVIGTTNGFSSTGSQAAGGALIAFKQAGNMYGLGSLWKGITTVTSDTNEKGIRFRPQENCELVGAAWPTDSATLKSGGSLKLYADASVPNVTTPLVSVALQNQTGGGTSPLPVGYLFPQASFYDLVADTWYRFVYHPPTSYSLPRRLTSGAGVDSDLAKVMFPYGGDANYCTENSGTWVDDTSGVPGFGPVLVPKTT